MKEYRRFYLSLDQASPEGSTAIGTPDGGIIWVGEEGTFPSGINSVIMTQEEKVVFPLTQLSDAVTAYINNRYSSGTQTSFAALSIQSVPVQVLVVPVWEWIKSVLVYYYSIKAAISSSNDPMAVTWDFSQFDATDPGVQLADLVS